MSNSFIYGEMVNGRYVRQKHHCSYCQIDFSVEDLDKTTSNVIKEYENIEDLHSSGWVHHDGWKCPDCSKESAEKGLLSAAGELHIEKNKNKQTCPHCKLEIPYNHVQMGNLHMGCADIELDVFFVSLPHDENSGYYDVDIESIKEFILNMEEPCIISNKKIKASKYYNLPEFDGF